MERSNDVKNLISTLKALSGNKDIQTSGNLEHQLRELDLEIAKELSDVHYPGKKKTDSEEAFALGLALGREVKEGIVYMIDLDSDILYFEGTEADIIRKIEDRSTENEEEALEKAQEEADKL